VASDSRSDLKAPIQGFETLQGVQQLQPGLARINAWLGKLLCVPDRELDSINGDAGLIGHLKFNRRGPRPHFGLDGVNNLTHDF
jgi:hypothetical protein